MICCSATLLAGCAAVPRASAPVPTLAWSQRRVALQGIEDFRIDGRMAAHAPHHGFSGGLHWRQHGQNLSIDLVGELGLGAAHVREQDGALEVTTSDGLKLGPRAAEARLEQTLGFEPPLHSLRYWLVGVDDPSAPSHITLDASHRLVRLAQSGWQIDYQQYAAVRGRWLPKRLTITRDALHIVLVVNRWRLRDSQSASQRLAGG